MSGIKGWAGDFLAAVFLLALVYVLVRPRSAAVAAVNAVTDALAALIGAATDL